jgi:antitoxin (DNA-binding transcriptional repressor) of toxin-antitoxin stability system
VHSVETSGQRYQITKWGKPVAIIVPSSAVGHNGDTESIEHDLAVWADIDQLAEEIGKRWPRGVSAVDALANDRR